MTHTLILLASLTFGWGLAAVVMRLAPRLTRWGDRRAFHQLSLFSPLLALVLSGGWSAEMALTGCLQFTTQDGYGTLLLMSGVGALLVVSAIRESVRVVQTKQALDMLVQGEAPAGVIDQVRRLAAEIGVKAPGVCMLPVARPVACLAGVRRPDIFLSVGMLEALTPEELESLVAHELAHERHLDNLLAWLDAILLRAFAFLPPLHRAWRESLAEREEAADVIAATATGQPRVLAEALVKVAAWSRHQPNGPGQANFNDDLELLERRVERLLTFERQTGRAWGLPAIFAAAVALVLPFGTAWALGSATSCIGHF